MLDLVRSAVRCITSRTPGAACALFVLAALAPRPLGAEDAPAPKPVALNVEALDATLYRISGTEAGAVLVLVGKKGLLLVDSEDAAHAAAFDSVLRTISPLPVKTIVNTHYHFDHIGGNERYRKKGAKVVAHENMWAQAVKDTVVADWGNWQRKPAPQGAKPQTTFADSLRLDFEGDPVVLTHVPAAHSNGDVMVWFPKHNVLHTGDVVEIGAPPFVDLWAGGTVGGMINGVDRFARASNEATRIVPGHGAIITRSDLREYRKMLATVANRAAESIREGRDLKGFLALEPAAQFEDRVGGARGARQLATLLFLGLNGMRTTAATP
jgi:glyoxylase-like metal-dependent hydrolase (beta-lactamase superfamily II)